MIVSAISVGQSFLLEGVAGEFQGVGVFRDSADSAVRGTFRHLSLDFQRYLDGGARLERQVLNYFLGNFAGVPADAIGIQANRTVEAFWFGWRHRYSRIGFYFRYSQLALHFHASDGRFR